MRYNEKKNVERSIALAGVFQSAALVRDLARTGETEKLAFDTSIQSIYTLDVSTVEQVYGGNIKDLRLGLQELVNLLAYTKLKPDREVTRYLIALMHLERKLIRCPETKQHLSRRIKHAISQANYFASSPQVIINSLADIYVATLGALPFRLHVVGQSKYLAHAETVSKIHAALLAGVRSVVLWRQLGGARWQLFLMRPTLIAVGKKLLSSLNSK